MSLLTVESKGIKFNVRIVQQGDNYGLNNCLTHEGKSPLVEFYDTRYPHTEFGQFISRYNIETLLAIEPNGGLNLYGGVPDWKIDAQTMNKITSWLESENKKLTKKLKM
jgi:hypothetical protein